MLHRGEASLHGAYSVLDCEVGTREKTSTRPVLDRGGASLHRAFPVRDWLKHLQHSNSTGESMYQTSAGPRLSLASQGLPSRRLTGDSATLRTARESMRQSSAGPRLFLTFDS